MASAPVSTLRLVTNYPHSQVTNNQTTLSALSAGTPTVLHLFTG